MNSQENQLKKTLGDQNHQLKENLTDIGRQQKQEKDEFINQFENTQMNVQYQFHSKIIFKTH